MEPAALPGRVSLADELPGCPADVEWAVGDTVVLLPMLDDVLLLLDSSTATIAMTPIAAAPIPAKRRLRDPVAGSRHPFGIILIIISWSWAAGSWARPAGRR